jgi:hypothetical protein
MEIADALSAPLGEIISAVGRGVADAQQALDEATLETLKKIYKGDHELLARLGYQPTWYKIPELNAEISISLTISGEVEASGTGGATSTVPASRIKLYAAHVDANYSNMYDYDFKAASVIRFKIVPVPPSPQTANLKVVPELRNKSYGEGKAILSQMDIPYRLAEKAAIEPSETELIRNTEPEAGELLSEGQPVDLEI